MLLYCFGGFGPTSATRALESLEGSCGCVGESSLLQTMVSTVGATLTSVEVMIRMRFNPREQTIIDFLQ